MTEVKELLKTLEAEFEQKRSRVITLISNKENESEGYKSTTMNNI